MNLLKKIDIYDLDELLNSDEFEREMNRLKYTEAGDVELDYEDIMEWLGYYDGEERKK